MIYIGTDGGATTSKVGGVWSNGSTISTKLLQSSTNSAKGPEAVVSSWVEAISAYLSQHELTWEQVSGVGLAVPGPFQRYGVLIAPPICLKTLPDSMFILPTATPSPNMPAAPSH